MKKMNINYYFLLSLFLILSSSMVVTSEVCGSVTCSQNYDTDGNCNAAGDGCNCNSGYENVSDGSCVLVCDAAVDGFAGGSTPDVGCNCTAGYTNAYSGTCVDDCGSCDGAGDTGFCSTYNKLCQCTRHYAYGKMDTCVPGYTCVPTCNDDKHTGTCDINGACITCGSTEGVNSEGLCAESVTCGSQVCIAGADTDGTCDLINKDACNCKDGYVNISDGSCGETCTNVECDGNGECNNSDGTAKCDCSDGYINDGSNFKTCVDACNNSCVGTGEDGCTTEDSSPKCKCLTDYKLKADDPLVCELDCSTCATGAEYEAGECSEVGGDLTCTCADGYTNENPRICANACGSSCEIGDDTKDYYTGDCATLGGVGSCVCASGYKHDAGSPLVCVLGDPCDDVACNTGSGYTGECEQDRGFAKCKCDDQYVNGADDLTTCIAVTSTSSELTTSAGFPPKVTLTSVALLVYVMLVDLC